eukprot:CAMPEP_0202818968 /NCGR_PEP_ID=MMETSP1389-20130828/8745_1 /ASSEMBLY_ACC=CAM_ASM_000865 /TAXON_ID=302021 /ORGANISM="Rhodomonas sp., Strain CCMP768" /LENGTH=179 /DNA_ID=CAMNT_0049491433 /DNA_START=118 /DNA_END=654 /DNA_ORIENTATION=-
MDGADTRTESAGAVSLLSGARDWDPSAGSRDQASVHPSTRGRDSPQASLRPALPVWNVRACESLFAEALCRCQQRLGRGSLPLDHGVDLCLVLFQGSQNAVSAPNFRMNCDLVPALLLALVRLRVRDREFLWWLAAHRAPRNLCKALHAKDDVAVCAHGVANRVSSVPCARLPGCLRVA